MDFTFEQRRCRSAGNDSEVDRHRGFAALLLALPLDYWNVKLVYSTCLSLAVNVIMTHSLGSDEDKLENRR